MKNLKIIIFVLLSALFCQTVFARGVQKVVIDAGHGGKDSGTVARDRRHDHEKIIALKIAKKVGRYIEKEFKDVEVIYTRTKDVFISLNERAKIANKANADLFISIHVDAVDNTKVHGASVYVLGLHRTKDNLKVAMRENAVMLQEDDYQANYAGFNPNDAESYIIFSLMQNQYINNSMTMASFVNKHLKSKTKRYTKGVKQAGFYVLREVGMPSILVETGYITNKSDANYLCSRRGQNKTALAIFNAFKDYKAFMEKHTTDLSLKTEVKKDKEKRKEPVQSSEKEAYFTVQVLYSKKVFSDKHPYFKGLLPILRHKSGQNYRYTYGKTQNYKEAQELLAKAKQYISGAYLIGFYKGKKQSAAKVRDILNGKK